MKNTEDCWGQKLSQILIKPNKDFSPVENEKLADEIIFVFEKNEVRILPVIDTDELSVTWFSCENTSPTEHGETTPIPNAYIGKSLSMTWDCVNANGYFDLYAIGFDQLHPNILILSEGSVLKLFFARQWDYKN